MTKDNDTINESLLTFPCDFTIKVIGKASDKFETIVLELIRHHLPDLSEHAIQSRPSENGKYQALSITVHVQSKAELDAIYKELSSSPDVLMAL